ncbi:MAG: OmpA family protein [Saprospiraceae bacterium]
MKLFVFCFVFIGLFINQSIAQESSLSMEDSTMMISRFEKVKPELKINNILVDEKNIIWLATNDGLLETLGDGSKLNSFLSGINVTDILIDKRNNVYATSEQTVYNVRSGEKYRLPGEDIKIKDIALYDGTLWVGTNKGLFNLILSTGKFKEYTSKNSKLKSDVVNFVHADQHKVLWVGTNQGYVRINGNKWDLEDSKRQMLATYENHEGQWIISDEDMFLVSPYNRLYPVKLDPNQYKGDINKFVIDSKGRIYIASDILVRYDPYKNTNTTYSNDASLLSQAALSLGVDKNDNVWIGTNGVGFYKLLFGDVLQEQVNAVIITENNVSCHKGNDGALKVNVSGGTKPYTYSWNFDANEKASRVSGLVAGKYEVTVTDKTQNSVVSEVVIPEPEEMVIDLVKNERVTNPENPDGIIEIAVKGGSGKYSFIWSNGKQTQNLYNAASGPYSINVKDSKGCEATASYIVKREKFIPDLEITKISLGQKLRINELNFDADSSAITQTNFDVLQEVLEFMDAHPQVKVEIGGHTNTIPPHEYCDKLSTDRARNVAKFLTDRGIEKKRVSFKGYGKREPLTDSTSSQGKAKNQRVEIKIISL